MNRGKNLAILLAITLALGGLLLLAREPVTDVGPTEKTEMPRQADWWFPYERELKDFRSATVILPSGQYVLDSDLAFDENGGMVGVYNRLGQPVLLRDDGNFRLRTDCYQTVMVLASHLPVTAEYDGLDRRSCGLDSPNAVVELVYETEAPVRLSIGNRTPAGDGCYVSLADGGKTYVAPADLYDVMCRDLKEQHALPAPSVKSTDEILQIALVTDGERWIANRVDHENTMNAWVFTSPIRREANTAGILRLAEGLLALKADRYETTVESADELTLYGLDQPTRLVAAFSDGEILDIRIGADAGNGYVYAGMDQTGDVWLIGRDQLDFMETVTPDHLLDPFVALVNYRQVERLEIRDDNGTVTLEPVKTDGEIIGWNANGIPLDDTCFSTLYTAAVGILWDRTALTEQAGTEELLTLAYRMTDGTTVGIRYTEYDKYYAMAETDNGHFLTRRNRLDPLLEQLGSIRDSLLK